MFSGNICYCTTLSQENDYIFVATQRSWLEANSSCAKLGVNGMLVDIRDNVTLSDLFRCTNQSESRADWSVWIGSKRCNSSASGMGYWSIGTLSNLNITDMQHTT
jgi:hypothetical protein